MNYDSNDSSLDVASDGAAVSTAVRVRQVCLGLVHAVDYQAEIIGTVIACLVAFLVVLKSLKAHFEAMALSSASGIL